MNLFNILNSNCLISINSNCLISINSVKIISTMEESNIIMNETGIVSRPVLSHQNTDIFELKKNTNVLINICNSMTARIEEISNDIKNITLKLEQFEAGEPETESETGQMPELESETESEPEPVI